MSDKREQYYFNGSTVEVLISIASDEEVSDRTSNLGNATNPDTNQDELKVGRDPRRESYLRQRTCRKFS